MIALDISNSMLAEDIQPSRLERAKQAISKLVDRLSNDKIGMVVFAGEAFIQLPITTDYASAKMFLSTINTNMIGVQGTAIGSAIEKSIVSFTPESETNKAIIVITDGENHEDDAVEKASQAVEKGIYVHTIGMGLPKGAPIPIKANNGTREYKKDQSGNVVVSKLNETMLQQIASAGNGIYIRANNTEVGLNALFDELNKMEKKEFEVESYSDYEDRFQYFIALSIFFLILEFIILNRRNKLFKDVNIFKIKS
jgi:Ca-activated chloride channel family protein